MKGGIISRSLVCRKYGAELDGCSQYAPFCRLSRHGRTPLLKGSPLHTRTKRWKKKSTSMSADNVLRLYSQVPEVHGKATLNSNNDEYRSISAIAEKIVLNGEVTEPL